MNYNKFRYFQVTNCGVPFELLINICGKLKEKGAERCVASSTFMIATVPDRSSARVVPTPGTRKTGTAARRIVHAFIPVSTGTECGLMSKPPPRIPFEKAA